MSVVTTIAISFLVSWQHAFRSSSVRQRHTKRNVGSGKAQLHERDYFSIRVNITHGNVIAGFYCTVKLLLATASVPSPSEARWGAGVGQTGAGKQASSASCWTLFITYLQDKKDVRVMKTCAQKVFVSSHYLYRELGENVKARKCRRASGNQQFEEGE